MLQIKIVENIKIHILKENVTSYCNIKMLQDSRNIHIIENDNSKLQNSLHVFYRGHRYFKLVPCLAVAGE